MRYAKNFHISIKKACPDNVIAVCVDYVQPLIDPETGLFRPRTFVKTGSPTSVGEGDGFWTASALGAVRETAVCSEGRYALVELVGFASRQHGLNLRGPQPRPRFSDELQPCIGSKDFFR